MLGLRRRLIAMLKELKFVQGAVAKKDFVPALTHFHIRGGRVMGYNGDLAISSPIGLDLEATPEALPFVKAIDTCAEEVSLTITDNNRLAVRSGKFKAFIRCTTEPYPGIEPEGEFVETAGGFLDALRAVLPFVSEDASRPWSRGVLLRGHSAYATNNVILVEHWLGYRFPLDLNIPKNAVNELLRIGEEPLGFQVTTTSITFYYTGKRWMRSVLYTKEWPDVQRILEAPALRTPIPEGFFEALHAVRPFVGESNRVHLLPTGISTEPTEDTKDGAFVALPMPNVHTCFNIEQLLRVEGVAQSLDIGNTQPDQPRPCLFYGKGLRGAVVGMRPV